jgi:uncharacterized protein (TIGR03435 family)
MRYSLFLFIPAALACAALQDQPPEPSFEVASIKPGAPLDLGRGLPWVRGGPGTPDPGMFTCTNCTIVDLIRLAYGPLSFGQFEASSALNSLIASPFDILAKVSPGTTRQEFRMMLRGLLVERFKVATHHEFRIMPAYELTVTKDGPKFKSAEPNNDPPPNVQSLGLPKRASDGSLIAPPGATLVAVKGQAKIQLLGRPIGELTQVLSTEFRMPILDKTGLTETYDISVWWRWEGQDGADRQASLRLAIQSQLGLQLRPNKGQVSVLVLDHVEKPTEN